MGSGRASKKTKLMVDDHEVPSSSLDTVVANDDLLIDILLRLPTCSLLLLKSVSKRWLSLITGPVYTTLRCSKNPNIEPLSGLFLQRYIHRDSPVIYDYVPFDIRFQVNRSPPVNTDFHFDFPDEGNVDQILQSCNGLLLCRSIHHTHFEYKPCDTRHYVYNPSTNQFKNFPPFIKYLGVGSNFGGMRLAFDPIISPYYKLVFAWEKRDYEGGYDYIKIQTYSSETGTWSICPEKFPNFKFFSFFRAIYWNNALHWIDSLRIHYKLDVENLVLTAIHTPDVLEPYSKLFESRGCLLLVGTCTNHTDDRTLIAIYEMRKGYSVWSKKYLVNLDDDINMKLFPLTGERQPAMKMRCYKVLCIVLGEKEEDSFLVLETCGKVVQYKIVLETVRELYDWGTLQPEVRGRYPLCYQYYASFAIV